jgi:tRNA A-37 threonylcarbamoyl transferase component Bud32/CheY-like chemotaxis protein
MRLLMIEDDARYSAAVRHHLSCRWPDAKLVVASPRAHGSLAPEFLAQGFDAVLLANSWPGGRGIDWARDLVSRPGFAPLIYMSRAPDDEEAREVLALGAHAAVCREKIDHERLLEAVGGAVEKQIRARAAWRGSIEGLEAQQFNGVHIRGYRFIRKLAGGAFSDLFLAEGVTACALVVMKLARDQQQGTELDQSFRRFLQEYEIVARIRHPLIVRLYDLGVSDEHAYLVMEYFRRGDLRERMRAGVTAREAIRYAIGIARALEAIHAAGILHRDLKPGNVMLREDGSIALIDFGLAKDAALATQITDHGMIFGTPHYMSPEQGHAESIDERSDLYSLGVILFEMLTGAKPYTAENPMAIIYKHRKEAMPKLPAEIALLQPVIEGLMAKQPVERFPSAAAALVALEAAAAKLAEK